MAWEWVAPTATAVVGLGGITATWLTARGGRQAQERLQESQRQENRALTLPQERRAAYGEFVAQLRTWQVRSSIQSKFTPLARKDDATKRDAIAKALEEGGWDFTVEQAMLIPEVAAVAEAQRAKSVAHLEVMSPKDTLEAFGTSMGLAAQIQLIAGIEVNEALKRVRAAMIRPFSYMLASSTIEDDASAELRDAIVGVEEAMAQELALPVWTTPTP